MPELGQLIDVRSTILGDVALFDLDRSLTGQEGKTYTRSPAQDAEPTSRLANRLFRSDDQIGSVYVFSNTVSVGRSGGWSDDKLDSASLIVRRLFVFYELETPADRNERLRAENYNSTITSIRAHNPDLWVVRVKPDNPTKDFKPGQYTTIALGFWEPRADDDLEDFLDDPDQQEKMARRSYSVSSSIVDDKGEVVQVSPDEAEFYIVQVPPSEFEVPSLTPRLFMKGVGDRVFMGRKFTGHYTLDDVKQSDNVVFLSTGTGEAPQNAMTAELLRNGHTGAILNVACVRYRRDLAYTSEQDTVQSKFPNYKYFGLTTRESEDLENKVYIQDLLTSGRIEKQLGAPLDPANTHVFLCGNPSMIGLPHWDSETGTMEFPEVVGVSQLLHERGFKIDNGKDRGNVHYEEYWKDR